MTTYYEPHTVYVLSCEHDVEAPVHRERYTGPVSRHGLVNAMRDAAAGGARAVWFGLPVGEVGSAAAISGALDHCNLGDALAVLSLPTRGAK